MKVTHYTGTSSYTKFVCVLKSGGDYDVEYVFALRRALRKHIPDWKDTRLICLTDLQIPTTLSSLPLRDGLPGWWSKIEAFRIIGPVIYIDLDTIILGSLDPLIVATKSLMGDFIMLKSFNVREKWASGIMAWKGNWSWLYTQFDPRQMAGLKWDQRYIKGALLRKDVSIRAVQDYQHGVYSYKHHCREELPKDASIVCFHGKPRPIDVEDEWRRKAWAA